MMHEVVDTVTLFVFFKSVFDDDHIETQDEVFVMQHCIFWSTHYQIGKSSHTLDTQKCQVMQSYDDEVSMEQYSKISICKNSLVEGKKHAHEDGYSSLVEPRLVSAKVLVISTDNFPPISQHRNSLSQPSNLFFNDLVKMTSNRVMMLKKRWKLQSFSLWKYSRQIGWID